jgi:GNAT superfamily N-acetyltransferase
MLPGNKLSANLIRRLVEFPNATMKRLIIRLANPEDGRAIYALLVEAFGNRYLGYTIYQAPQSSRYLRELIKAQPRNNHHVAVAEREECVIGYYEALAESSRLMLNYLAVATPARANGVGSVLMRHLQDVGRTLGCTELLLDVFQKNERAVAWYARQGFLPCSAVYKTRLRLNRFVSVGSYELECRTPEWKSALAEERLQGFSKIDVECGPGQLTMGLIAGSDCCLLAYKGVAWNEAVEALARCLRGLRRHLIVSTECPPDPGLPISSCDVLLRMGKAI